ncbi:MAG: oligosaccharide flippase family protein [Candidatus Coatesbacteria bacterium]
MALSHVSDLLFYLMIFGSFPLSTVGAYSGLMAAMAFVSLAVDMGVSPGLVREFARNRYPPRLVVMEATRLRRLPVALCGLVFSLWACGLHPRKELVLAVAFAAAAQILRTSTNTYSCWLRGVERQETANALLASGSLGRLAVLGGLVYARGVPSLATLFGALLFVEIVIWWSARSYARSRREFRVHAGMSPQRTVQLRNVLRVLRRDYLGISGLTTIQNRLDWVLVSRMLSSGALALYAMANKWYEICQSLLGMALTAILPTLSREGDRPGASAAGFLRVVLLASGLLSVGGALIGPELLRLLWADKYAGGELSLRLLMLAVVFATFNAVGFAQLVARHGERIIVRSTMWATLIQLAVNLVAIPRLGILGAVLGMWTLVVSVGLMYAFSNLQGRKVPLLDGRTYLYMILMVAGVIGLIGLNTPLVIRIPAGVVLWALSALVLSGEARRLLHSFWARMEGDLA